MSAPGLGPTDALVAAVEEALGVVPVAWRRPSTGLSAAQRFVVSLADGSSAFVKAAVDDDTERWLRTDHLVMTGLGSLAPDVLAWTEAAGRPVLVMEDLHDAHWPADHHRPDGEPVWWKEGQVELAFAALARLAEVAPPEGLDLLGLEAGFQAFWPGLAASPGVVVELGLGSTDWVDGVVGDLVAAEASLNLSGGALVHNDVRSDNVCFRGDRVILVDWSDARIGSPSFDRANLAQTLPLEGGPDPEDVAPDAGPFAAWRAGELVHRASGAFGEVPAWLARVMRRMAAIDLDWAARCLGLPARDGADWRSI